MKKGDTVFIIDREQHIIEGVLGDEITTQGFYTRWGPGHEIFFTVTGHVNAQAHNNENIFSTRISATKELFTRRLRYPQFYRAA